MRMRSRYWTTNPRSRMRLNHFTRVSSLPKKQVANIMELEQMYCWHNLISTTCTLTCKVRSISSCRHRNSICCGLCMQVGHRKWERGKQTFNKPRISESWSFSSCLTGFYSIMPSSYADSAHTRKFASDNRSLSRFLGRAWGRG